jgi:hypothetical protein
LLIPVPKQKVSSLGMKELSVDSKPKNSIEPSSKVEPEWLKLE